MPHINLGNDAFGITSLFEYRPEMARPLCELAEALLRGPSTLTNGERELIAAYVSSLNECSYCTDSHAAFAAAQLPVEQILARNATARDASCSTGGSKSRSLRGSATVNASGLRGRAAPA